MSGYDLPGMFDCFWVARDPGRIPGEPGCFLKSLICTCVLHIRQVVPLPKLDFSLGARNIAACDRENRHFSPEFWC